MRTPELPKKPMSMVGVQRENGMDQMIMSDGMGAFDRTPITPENEAQSMRPTTPQEKELLMKYIELMREVE